MTPVTLPFPVRHWRGVEVKSTAYDWLEVVLHQPSSTSGYWVRARETFSGERGISHSTMCAAVPMERDAVCGLVIGPPQVFEGSPQRVGSARALNTASG